MIQYRKLFIEDKAQVIELEKLCFEDPLYRKKNISYFLTWFSFFEQNMLPKKTKIYTVNVTQEGLHWMLKLGFEKIQEIIEGSYLARTDLRTLQQSLLDIVG